MEKDSLKIICGFLKRVWVYGTTEKKLYICVNILQKFERPPNQSEDVRKRRAEYGTYIYRRCVTGE